MVNLRAGQSQRERIIRRRTEHTGYNVQIWDKPVSKVFRSVGQTFWRPSVCSGVPRLRAERNRHL